MNKTMIGLAAALALSTGAASASHSQTINIYFTKAPTYGPSPMVVYPEFYINGSDTGIDLSSTTSSAPEVYTVDPSLGFKGVNGVAVSYGMNMPILAQCTPLPSATASNVSYALTQDPTSGDLTCKNVTPA